MHASSTLRPLVDSNGIKWYVVLMFFHSILKQNFNYPFSGISLVEKEVLDFLPAFTGNQRLLVNTSVGIPLAQRQERLALLKL